MKKLVKHCSFFIAIALIFTSCYSIKKNIKPKENPSIEISTCDKNETAAQILQKTINSIDTINTIYYKQDMFRSSPINISDTIFRFREMYFQRLKSDSIVGVMGYWKMYGNDNVTVFYEDVYDGNRLIRKNLQDSLARIYDLNKYPDFRKVHFWSHNTLYGMQYEFRFFLKNLKDYQISRLNDTTINGKGCFQVIVTLKDKTTMPGFAAKLEDNLGCISESRYFICKKNYYPIGIKNDSYTTENPEQKSFINQIYYDIKFNLKIENSIVFNTTKKSLIGFKTTEIKPD